MNKVFCSSCGHKNVYEVTKPKFCSACGTPIGASAPAPARKEAVAEIEYEEEGSRSFDLERMKRDVVAEASSQQTTLTDLWKSATPEDANRSRTPRPAPNLPNGEAMIKQSQADCSSSRIQDIDG
jgi:hypothetical protein